MNRPKAGNVQLEYIDKWFTWIYFCRNCNTLVKVDKEQVKLIDDTQVLYCEECYRELFTGIKLSN